MNQDAGSNLGRAVVHWAVAADEPSLEGCGLREVSGAKDDASFALERLGCGRCCFRRGAVLVVFAAFPFGLALRVCAHIHQHGLAIVKAKPRAQCPPVVKNRDLLEEVLAPVRKLAVGITAARKVVG